jgi:hypothetical protein
MKTALLLRRRTNWGIMLLEALVYIAVLTIVLGCGTALLYRSWGHNVALRRTSDDIIAALNAGELWRSDIRSAAGHIKGNAEELRIPTGKGEIVYSFTRNDVRRSSPNQPTRRLTNVKSSQMLAEKRGQVAVWRWEVELNSNHKKVQLRPLFTFEAVANRGGTP